MSDAEPILTAVMFPELEAIWPQKEADSVVRKFVDGTTLLRQSEHRGSRDSKGNPIYGPAVFTHPKSYPFWNFFFRGNEAVMPLLALLTELAKKRRVSDQDATTILGNEVMKLFGGKRAIYLHGLGIVKIPNGLLIISKDQCACYEFVNSTTTVIREISPVSLTTPDARDRYCENLFSGIKKAQALIRMKEIDAVLENIDVVVEVATNAATAANATINYANVTRSIEAAAKAVEATFAAERAAERVVGCVNMLIDDANFINVAGVGSDVNVKSVVDAKSVNVESVANDVSKYKAIGNKFSTKRTKFNSKYYEWYKVVNPDADQEDSGSDGAFASMLAKPSTEKLGK